ncbi:hypothetical protein C0995_007570 [Termitomyces sp. Mi166|nr:hypothetical protein C0995_007570 [Termitomyces sp. Mi166\
MGYDAGQRGRTPQYPINTAGWAMLQAVVHGADEDVTISVLDSLGWDVQSPSLAESYIAPQPPSQAPQVPSQPCSRPPSSSHVLQNDDFTHNVGGPFSFLVAPSEK